MGPTVTVPTFLMWLELSLLVLATLLAIVRLMRDRKLRSVCLLAAVFVIATGRGFDLLPLMFMHSPLVQKVAIFFMPILWVRWLGPLFLVAYLFSIRSIERRLRVGNPDS